MEAQPRGAIRVGQAAAPRGSFQSRGPSRLKKSAVSTLPWTLFPYTRVDTRCSTHTSDREGRWKGRRVVLSNDHDHQEQQ